MTENKSRKTVERFEVWGVIVRKNKNVGGNYKTAILLLTSAN